MNLKIFIFASEPIASSQQPIIKKELMDVITTDVVKEEQVHGNSSNNFNLGELSNPASNLIPDVATPSLTLDSLSSVVINHCGIFLSTVDFWWLVNICK